jgi:hypothetical protein
MASNRLMEQDRVHLCTEYPVIHFQIAHFLVSHVIDRQRRHSVPFLYERDEADFFFLVALRMKISPFRAPGIPP